MNELPDWSWAGKENSALYTKAQSKGCPRNALVTKEKTFLWVSMQEMQSGVGSTAGRSSTSYGMMGSGSSLMNKAPAPSAPRSSASLADTRSTPMMESKKRKAYEQTSAAFASKRTKLGSGKIMFKDVVVLRQSTMDEMVKIRRRSGSIPTYKFTNLSENKFLLQKPEYCSYRRS